MECVTIVSTTRFPSDKFSIQCQHIMASNFDKGWVALVILHFVIQVTLQGLTLRDNMQAKDVTNLCLSLAQAPSGLALLKSDGLNMCDGIPGHANVTCILLASRIASPPSLPEAMTPRSLTSFDLDGISSITIAGVEHSLTGRCALSLHWIHDMWVINNILVLLLTQWQFSRQCGRRRRNPLLPVLASDRVSIGSEWTSVFPLRVSEVPTAQVLQDSIPHLYRVSSFVPNWLF